jgi:hypothetical protein
MGQTCLQVGQYSLTPPACGDTWVIITSNPAERVEKGSFHSAHELQVKPNMEAPCFLFLDKDQHFRKRVKLLLPLELRTRKSCQLAGQLLFLPPHSTCVPADQQGSGPPDVPQCGQQSHLTITQVHTQKNPKCGRDSAHEIKWKPLMSQLLRLFIVMCGVSQGTG